MKQDEWRKRLVGQRQTDATASPRVSSAKRVEQHLGDLDELFAQEDRDNILNRFTYTADDERAERPNPPPVPIDGVLRTGLASLQQSLKLYHSFLTEQTNMPDKAEYQALLDRLTRKEVDVAMQECDQQGLKAFLARGGFASPQEWVSDEGKDQSCPAKAASFRPRSSSTVTVRRNRSPSWKLWVSHSSQGDQRQRYHIYARQDRRSDGCG